MRSKGKLRGRAEIECLWIGEKKPDTFSRWIQYFLTWVTGRSINYSHNAFIFTYTGKVWEATTPGGVVETDLRKAVSGSVIRYRKKIKLDCTNEVFAAWLDGERGKAYGHRGNMAAVLKWIFRIPYIHGICDYFSPPNDEQRVCSEFLALALCKWSNKYCKVFPKNKDAILPTDTYKAIILGKPIKKGEK